MQGGERRNRDRDGSKNQDPNEVERDVGGEYICGCRRMVVYTEERTFADFVLSLALSNIDLYFILFLCSRV